MSRLSLGKIARICAALSGLWALSVLISACLGSVPVSPGTVFALVRDRLLGSGSDTTDAVILFSVRLPRIFLASLAGAALAIAGAAFQSLLRNPLADPYVLGVSTGASTGTILLSMAAGSVAGSASGLHYFRPLAAFAGAAITIALVYVIAGGGGRSVEGSQRLLLAGVILASFISAINVFLLTTTDQADLRGIFYWLIGDLSRPVDGSIYAVAAFVLAGAGLLYLYSQKLNLIAIGETDALALGVEVPRIKLGVYLIASLVTGAVVSISGPIPYIGLICPHLARMVFGIDNRILFPAVFLTGATFTVFADAIARTALAPAELPVGVITAVCGAPLFIYLLRRKGVK
jgi:iron complex transport system permease protein